MKKETSQTKVNKEREMKLVHSPRNDVDLWVQKTKRKKKTTNNTEKRDKKEDAQSQEIKNRKENDKSSENKSQEIAVEVIVVVALLHHPPEPLMTLGSSVHHKRVANQVEEDIIHGIEKNVVNEGGADLQIESEIIVEEEIIKEYIVDDSSGILMDTEKNMEKHTDKGNVIDQEMRNNTYCVFRKEGSLFPGRVLKVTPINGTVSVLQECFIGGWSCPSNVETYQVNKADIVNIIRDQQISGTEGRIYIDDDILYMEWGE